MNGPKSRVCVYFVFVCDWASIWVVLILALLQSTTILQLRFGVEFDPYLRLVLLVPGHGLTLGQWPFHEACKTFIIVNIVCVTVGTIAIKPPLAFGLLAHFAARTLRNARVAASGDSRNKPLASARTQTHILAHH